MKKLCVCWLSVTFAIGTGVVYSADSTASGNLLFERDIRPIFKTHCFHCHGEEKGDVKAGLDVRLKRFLEKGGKSGPAIIPGDAAKSPLLEKLKSGDMPKKKPKLRDADIALIEKWVANGAPTARPEPETLGDEATFTEEERVWWSLQPIKNPPIPTTAATKSTNPIDRFIGAKLIAHQLGFSKEADSATLIRRVTFDLIGLPPKPEEIAAFQMASKKDSAKAISDLVDRLLDSPFYGERWGRHWLDVAGYADSEGYNEKDVERKQAWRFRDYVIRSFQSDKPFDEFVREQLAGDEIAAEMKIQANSPPQLARKYGELLAATGFLRMAADGTQTKNDIASRNACINDTMKIVSSAFLGMTLGCAQCHDHKYDPISQADYYRLRAIFEPGFDMKNWRVPSRRQISLQTKEGAAKAAAIEVEAKKIDDARLKKQKKFIAEVLEKELLGCDEKIRDTLRTAYHTAVAKRTPEQTKLLTSHPTVLKLNAGSLYLYDPKYKTKNAAELKKLVEDAKAVRAKKPPVDYVRAFTEPPRKPDAIPVTHVFHRGDPESPEEVVEPGDLSVLGTWRKVDFPENNDAIYSTGRRLAFARSLTDGKHPLLARVIVNRVWMEHFGKGLVSTPGDFGRLGGKPSHPALLDWLATEFMKSGWSLKKLHRLILTSQTWGQESARDAKRNRIDPDNQLLSRQNPRRLEAETLRDTMLAVSGKLNPKQFGVPVPVMPNEEGAIVIGEDTTDAAGRQTGKYIPLNGEEFRRSIYVEVRRTRPLGIFAAFDAPSMVEANCEIRPVTTVSPQSLLLMNNSAMREFAEYFAERLRSEGGPDTVSKIKTAWVLSYGREPTAAEVKTAQEFLAAQTEYYKTHPAKFERVAGPPPKENAAPELLAMAALCHSLMSSNEFLYID